MAIEIEFDCEKYSAKVLPPHGTWQSERPMSATELDDVLVKELKCHQTDVGDAFYEADPDWLERT